MDQSGCRDRIWSPGISAEVQLDTEASGAVQGTVIGNQEKASTSKNSFLSEAIPPSNIVPEKVKNQIRANEFIDFFLITQEQYKQYR